MMLSLGFLSVCYWEFFIVFVMFLYTCVCWFLWYCDCDCQFCDMLCILFWFIFTLQDSQIFLCLTFVVSFIIPPFSPWDFVHRVKHAHFFHTALITVFRTLIFIHSCAYHLLCRCYCRIPNIFLTAASWLQWATVNSYSSDTRVRVNEITVISHLNGFSAQMQKWIRWRLI